MASSHPEPTARSRPEATALSRRAIDGSVTTGVDGTVATGTVDVTRTPVGVTITLGALDGDDVVGASPIERFDSANCDA